MDSSRRSASHGREPSGAPSPVAVRTHPPGVSKRPLRLPVGASSATSQGSGGCTGYGVGDNPFHRTPRWSSPGPLCPILSHRSRSRGEEGAGPVVGHSVGSRDGTHKVSRRRQGPLEGIHRPRTSFPRSTEGPVFETRDPSPALTSLGPLSSGLPSTSRWCRSLLGPTLTFSGDTPFGERRYVSSSTPGEGT